MELTFLKKAFYASERRGFSTCLKEGFSFVGNKFLINGNYYIFTKEVNTEKSPAVPKVKDFALIIITRPDEIDALILRGFDIEYFSYREDLKRLINKKAILFCGFIVKKLVHQQWLALEPESKNEIDPIPFNIDFRTEACLGDARTKPEFRGLGIDPYVLNASYCYAKSLGLKVKLSVKKTNIAALKSNYKVGNRICSEGRYVKLLWRSSWKERPL